MKKTLFVLYGALALGFSAVLSLALEGETQEVEAQEADPRPNVVYVVTDDMRKDDLEKMPLTKAALQDQGMSFENFYVSDPLCCPSRTSALTGQYVHNHKTYVSEAEYNAQGHNLRNVVTMLDGAGYSTAMIGKYLNGYYSKTGVPPGFDEWYVLASDQLAGYYNYTLNQNGQPKYYGAQLGKNCHSKARSSKTGKKKRHLRTCKPPPVRPGAYQTDVFARLARSFVQRKAAEDAPFFAYVAPTAPHGPRVPAPRHQDAFKGVPSSGRYSPAFNEADVSDKPAYVRNRPRLTTAQQHEINEASQSRWEMLQSVDQMVAGLVADVEAAGELPNTYFYFTSDNGWMSGEHRLPNQKLVPYEESSHMPFLVRGPGVPAGTVTEELASNIDLAPTWLELAGVPTTASMDGRSLVPLQGGEAPPSWRTHLLFEWYQPRGFQVPTYNALVRGDGKKYVSYATGEEELYDLLADPHELDSLHASADPALLAELSAELSELKACSGESCRVAEGGQSAGSPDALQAKR